MNTRPICAIPPLLALSAVAVAENAIPAAENENQAIKTQIQAGFEQLNRTQTPTQNEKTLQKSNITEINNDDLAKNPDLFHQIMQQALNRQDAKLLSELTKAYEKLPQADLQTLRRSQASLARWQGNYRQAVKKHLDLKRDFPQDSRIALDTAATLFEDKQWLNAKTAFQAAQHDFRLPENVNRNVERYLNQIKQANKWQFGGSLAFSRNQNINNAAPEYCTPFGCQNEKQINAIGLNYRAHIAKNTPLRGHHNLLVRGNVNGTSYYFSQKSQYDSAFGRAYAGWQYQNAKQTVSVLPFYQFQLAGSDEFDNKPIKNKTLKMNALASATGVQIVAARQFSARLGGYVSAERYRQKYKISEKAQRYNGLHTQFALGTQFRITPQQSVSAHVSRQVFKPQHREFAGRTNNAAYTRHSVGAAWQARWQKLGGLHTEFQAAIAQRKYKGQALNTAFEWQPQRNRERIFSVSVAHEKIRVAGFMPKIVAEYSKTNSSHAWSNRKQKQIFIELSKHF